MDRNPLPYPLQMRNGGSPPAHLPSSTAPPLDPLRWLAPPQRAPEPQPPVRTSDAATSALAHYEEIMSQQMISLHEQALAECAELAAHAQRVETARSVALAAWRRQEDAAHAQALAEEADIRRNRDDTFRAITDGFAIDLDILAVEMASWHGADDAMALLAMKRREDDANAQGHLDGRAAMALRTAATRTNVLVASCRREDDAYAKAFASATDKRNRRETTLRANQLRYMAQLGFTSSSKFFAWVAECDASWDGAATESDVQRRHEVVLAAEAADVQRRHESAAQATESDAAIERIRTEFALCAAPLDAILAEIACEEAAITTTLSPERPTSYVDAVLSNMEGGTQPSLPLAGSPALPSPDVASQLQTVRPCARPRRRTGRRNVPRAPSSSVAVAPTHPDLLQGGLPTPTSTTLAGATSPCRSVVSSTPPGWTTPDTPSLQPFTFHGGAVHSSGGGNAHPFHACGPPTPPRTHTRHKLRPGRVCRRHGPRAPNILEPLLCGRRHRPRAPNECGG